jgi:hypothetical protein
MNNFHFIDVKPSIERSEISSIKEAIFKRAKEKSNTLASETSENYTTQVQSDVMDIARDAFNDSSLNPFNQFIENVGINKPNTPTVKQSSEIVSAEAPQKTETPDITEIYTREIKRNIESVSNKTYQNSVKDETMAAARGQFRPQTNLMATLGFLNTQAAIKMAENAHSKINYMS